jgi:hypothetical protein
MRRRAKQQREEDDGHEAGDQVLLQLTPFYSHSPHTLTQPSSLYTLYTHRQRLCTYTGSATSEGLLRPPPWL